MSLKIDLIDTLGTLKPFVDPTKGQLENDEAVKYICSLISEPAGLLWLEFIINHLENGKAPLYSPSRFIPEGKLVNLIESLYKSKNRDALRILLLMNFQVDEIKKEFEDLSKAISTLEKITSSKAVQSKSDVYSYCLSCSFTNTNTMQKCSQCGDDEILTISEVSLVPQIRQILSNGQYLEIYTKHCLKDAGVELIGYPIDNRKGSLAYTNVRYQVDGDQIELDVHGIANPLAFLLCEVKTQKKIELNELRRVDGLYDHLIEKVNTFSGRNFPFIKLFVITGEFDKNISEGAYKRKYWELIDRTKIKGLRDVIKKIQTEL